MCDPQAPTGRERCERGAGSSPLPDFRFPRRLRIAETRVFREAFDRRSRAVGRLMVLWLYCGEDAGLRLGVVASKRTFRRAVDRARAKRLLREAFRLNRYRLRGQADLVLVARRAILGATRPEVEKELLYLARKARILEPAATIQGDGREHS